MYTQAQVHGLGADVRGHGDRRYTYHTDLHRTIPCPAITTD